jgi:hypothetical protein
MKLWQWMRSFFGLKPVDDLVCFCKRRDCASHYPATSCHRSSWPRVPWLRRSGLGLRSASAYGSLRRHT